MAKFNFRSDKDFLIKNLYKAVTIITIILVISAIFFVNNILRNEYKSAELYLQQSVLQTASNIRVHIKNDINNLKILSEKITEKKIFLSKNEISKFLEKNINENNYYKIGFSSIDGKGFQYNRQNKKIEDINWNEKPCFANAVSGNPCFSETNIEDLAISGIINRYFVPVFNEKKEVVGILGAEIDSDILKKILSLNNYDGKAYSHIIDSNGNYIIKSQNDNNKFTNFFNAKIKYIKTNKEQVQETLKAQNSGTFWFKKNKGNVYIGAFAFIGNNNSYVLTEIPKDTLMLNISTLLGGLTVIVLLIEVILLALLKYVSMLYKKNEAAIYKLAFTDEVTENKNKSKFILDVKEIFDNSKDETFAIISVDIANFKVINELFGCQKANKILKDVYYIIQSNLSSGSICARDFAATYIVLYKYEKENMIIKHFVQKVTSDIEKYNNEIIPMFCNDKYAKIITKLSPVFGIYLIEDKKVDLMQMCDRAVLAKRGIKNDTPQNYKFYDDGLKAKVQQNKIIEEEMLNALQHKQFKMYLQPKFDLKTMELVGAEALVRWFHPKRGIIPPMDFIPVFENNGFVIEVDKFIWRQACDFLSLRKLAGEKLFPISVNVSKTHLNNEVFIEELLNLTKKYNIEPKYIELELTESACLNNEKQFKEVTEKLKSLGFKIVMDNFGTGFSSVNMLKNLSVDILKLDRTFISNAFAENKGKIIFKNMIEMANQLDILTVAEGIETPEQMEYLKEIGCKIAQGFLFGRPMDENNFIHTFLSHKKNNPNK